ncbi:hypothetical protein BLSMQ_3052 [Brevibacterium aurantiacum]|uniref:Uncharacterized protein n=1 Tax=Brevibacterium aurantiacum TaxID=273384 RepID=A0A1D7W700_BREAU|nr:hypothetical protein BLSMQ_3052 [Brevibacterium aurantiacum]
MLSQTSTLSKSLASWAERSALRGERRKSGWSAPAHDPSTIAEAISPTPMIPIVLLMLRSQRH